MNRRNFMGLSASVAVGYQVGKRAEDRIEYSHPEIVHHHSTEPVQIIPTSDGVKIIDPNDIQSELRLTANKYGDPTEVYEDYNLEPGLDEYSIDHPSTSEVFSYTLYSEDKGYVGESNPLRIESGKVIEAISEIPHVDKADYPFRRETRRGYFEIRFGDNDISFPISYQRYLMSSRVIGYGGAHEYAVSSNLLEQTGKRILDQSDADTEFEKMKTLVRPNQEMNWESDMNSIGKYEYIRDPARTFVEMTGDCKDRTVINNGFLEGALGIETSIMFVTGHMLTGVSFESLNSQTRDSLSDSSTIYEGQENSYIAVDSTSARDIGFNIPKPMYAIYNDYYQLYSVSGLVDHVTYALPKLMLFESF